MRLRRGIALVCGIAMLGSVIQYDKITTYAEDTEWSVELSEENFPDDALRRYLSDTIDEDDDTIITKAEMTDFIDKEGTGLNFPPASIKDITGLEKLEGITGFMFDVNPIEYADMSVFTTLKRVYIYSPVLKYLNISNPTITDVTIGCQNVDNIIWGDKSKYTYINISNSGYKEFNAKEFSNIDYLFMEETDISEIDVTTNEKLYRLLCGGSEISELDVSKNTKLSIIDCGGCHLQELDLINNTNLVMARTNVYRKRSKTSLKKTDTEAKQQVYFVATRNPSGKYTVTLDGISDSTRMLNITSGTASDNVISWNSLSEVPSTFSYQYDTMCPQNEYITEDVYLDVNVNVVRPADISGITDISGDSVTVNWESEQTEDDETWEVPVSYEVYRSTSENGTYSKIDTVENGGTSYTDTSVESGNTYYYKTKTVKDTYKGELTSEYGEAVAVTIAPEIVNIKSVTQSGTDKAVISWSEAEGAEAYEVYRSTSVNGTYNKIGTVAGTSYTDIGLACGDTYYYKVISKNGSLTADSYSSVLSVQIKPLAPEGLKLTQDKNSVKISYDKSEGADGYEIYASSNKNGTYQLIKTTTGTSFTENSLKYGDSRYYKVRAYTKKGTSKVYGGYTSVKGISLKLVSSYNKSVSVAAYNKLKLSWAAMSGADGYEIRRSEKASGTYKKIADVRGASYTDTGLTCGKEYYYKVVPYIKNGDNKTYADAGSYISGKTRPNVGSISSVKRSAYNKLKISYTKGAGATGYVIYRSTRSNGTYKKVGTSKGLSYTDTVSCGTTYYYKVRAYTKTDSGNVYSKSYSKVVSGKATLSSPEVNLASGSKRATISIEKVSGADGYEIYMSTKKSSGYKKIKTVSSKTLRYTKSGLTKGKRYYIKVRAYKTVNKSKVYSSYSAIKSVKVK